MKRNIELKARFPDLARAHQIAKSIGALLHDIERQLDTYFRIPQGRLKLRQRWRQLEESAPGPTHLNREIASPSQLIWYHRTDEARPRPSDYSLVEVADGDALRILLSGALGVVTEVLKLRTIYLFDNVRIHLDHIDALGSFLEFEAIVDDECRDDAARTKLDALRRAFQLHDESILSQSYEGLLRAHPAAR